jgi:hypothetical protein
MEDMNNARKILAGKYTVEISIALGRKVKKGEK